MTYHTPPTQEASSAHPTSQILTILHKLLSQKENAHDESGTALPVRRGRPTILHPDHLIMALLLAVLEGFTGVAQVWRLITWRGVDTFPLLDLTRAAIRKRLLHVDFSQWQQMLLRVQSAVVSFAHLRSQADLAPFAPCVLAIDQSTLDAVKRRCHDVRKDAKGAPHLLVGKITGLFDIRTQCWRRILFCHDVFSNEKLFVDEVLFELPKGSLILADLGFFSFSWFDRLADQGFFFLTRMREKTTFQIQHVFVQQGWTLDALIWLGAYRSDQAKHLMRLIRFEVGGKRYEYLTNVCDPALLSLSDAARLYARRWDIELAFKLLKTELGLSIWWSSHPALVLQQLFCGIILAQVLHALHLRVAAEAGVDLFDVSLPVLVKLLVSAPACSQGESFLDRLLVHGRRQGLLRPSRRYHPITPALLSPYPPVPDTICWTRKPRYAARKCREHSTRVSFLPRFPSFLLI